MTTDQGESCTGLVTTDQGVMYWESCTGLVIGQRGTGTCTGLVTMYWVGDH